MNTSSPAPIYDPIRREKTLQTILYYAVFIALGCLSSTFGPTLLELAQNTGVGIDTIAAIFTVASLGTLLCSLVVGQLYDRLKPHGVLVAFLLIVAGANALVPLLHVFWALLLSSFVLGFAATGVNMGGNTLLVWTHRDEVGPYMNGLHFFYGVGATISPAIIALVRNLTGGITWAYWILALIVLPIALAATGVKSPTSPAEHISAETMEKGALNKRLVFVIMLIFFFYTAVIGYSSWVATYAIEMDLADTTLASLLTAAFWGALTVGRVIAIPIAARVTPRYILLADILGALLSIFIVLLLPGSITALWIGTCGLGFSLASMFPTIMTMSERRMTLTGRVTGFFFLASSLGAMAMPWITGQLIEIQGARSMVAVVFSGLILILGAYALLISDRKKHVPYLPNHPEYPLP
ncbi:MAG: MFS transporter [Anaerolineales bacterium]|nr:MFS transporter [Anaerolineales bacterium]